MICELEKQRMLYQTLALPNNSSIEEVRRAFKSLALLHHPDKNPSDPVGAATRFRDITTAYQILSVPERKMVYDKKLAEMTAMSAGGVSGRPSGTGVNTPPHRRHSHHRNFSAGANAAPPRKASFTNEQQEQFRQQEKKREKEMKLRKDAEKDERMAEEAERARRKAAEKAKEAVVRESERQKEHEKLKEQLRRLQEEREKQKERNEEAMKRVMNQIMRQRSNTLNSGGDTSFNPATRLDKVSQRKDSTFAAEEEDDNFIILLSKLEKLESQDREQGIEAEEQCQRQWIFTRKRQVHQQAHTLVLLGSLEEEESHERHGLLRKEARVNLMTTVLCADGYFRIGLWCSSVQMLSDAYAMLNLAVLECKARSQVQSSQQEGFVNLFSDFACGIHALELHETTLKNTEVYQLQFSEVNLRNVIWQQHDQLLAQYNSEYISGVRQSLQSMESQFENRLQHHETKLRLSREAYASQFSEMVALKVSLTEAIAAQNEARTLQRQLQAATLRKQMKELENMNETLRQQTSKSSVESKELVMMLCKENKRLLTANAKLIEENWKLNGRLREEC